MNTTYTPPPTIPKGIPDGRTTISDLVLKGLSKRAALFEWPGGGEAWFPLTMIYTGVMLSRFDIGKSFSVGMPLRLYRKNRPALAGEVAKAGPQ